MGSIEAERRKNEELGKQFCDALVSNGFASTAAVVSAGTNEDPDLVANVDGTRVFVELTEYRQPGPHVRAERNADALEIVIEQQLASGKLSMPVRLVLEFREERDARGMHFALPKKHKHQEFAQACVVLADAVLRLGLWRGASEVRAGFGDPQLNEHAELFHKSPRRYWWFGPDELPVLSGYCTHITVVRQGSGTLPTARCIQLQVRIVSGCAIVARESVRRKIEKLKHYRKQSGELPCWLVVHSGGQFMSSLIDRNDLPKVCAAAREECAHHEERFDAAWWLDAHMLNGENSLYAIA